MAAAITQMIDEGHDSASHDLIYLMLEQCFIRCAMLHHKSQVMYTYSMLKKMIPAGTITLLTVCLLAAGGLKAQSKPWPVPAVSKDLKNPQKENPAALKDGKTLYGMYCAPCHGDKGKGDGPAAAALTPKPADHTSSALLAETDGSLFYKISEGRTPMPQFKTSLSETQRWELVTYIRSLSKSSKK